MCLCVVVFGKKAGLLCSPGWFGTHCMAQRTGLKLRIFLSQTSKCWITGVHHYARPKTPLKNNNRNVVTMFLKPYLLER